MRSSRTLTNSEGTLPGRILLSTIGIDKKGEWNDVVESMQWV